MKSNNQLENDFDAAMHGNYERMQSEVGYKASIFLAMLNDCGGLEAAQKLIHSPEVSDGYTVL